MNTKGPIVFTGLGQVLSVIPVLCYPKKIVVLTVIL